MAEMPPLFVGLRRRAYYMAGKRYTRARRNNNILPA
jgi:hypothetical protein